MTDGTAKADWTLVIHGGAGAMQRGELDSAVEAGARAGLNAALDAGATILAAGGAAIDAVEAAIRVLEDDPHFNAGHGAALTLDGTVELDAAIMDGATRRAGAVAGVGTIRHPVSLARAVMDDGRHVMFAGKGADAFGQQAELDTAGPDWFTTEERRRQWIELRDRPQGAFDTDLKYGTVGAVARDAAGHVAAATSTGGITGKLPGRIGDTPVIGAGTYADDRACAVSATGTGEIFIRAAAAHEIAARMRLSAEPIDTATRAVLDEVGDLGGRGGIIAIAPDGAWNWAFNTRGLYRGRAGADGTRTVAIFDDEP